MAIVKKKEKRQDQLEDRLLAESMEADELEVDLVALMYRLLEKAKWLIAAALLGAILAGVFTVNFVTPMYKSTAKLYVLNSKDSAININDLNIGEKLAEDYVQVFKNWHVHEKVISSLNLPYSYTEIQKMLSISIPSSTRIIQITVTSADPQEARNIAMAYAEFAPAFIEAKMETDRPNIFEEARVPVEPSSPNKLRNVILGFIAGMMVAAIIVIIQFIVDDRIRNAEALEKRLGLPVLGMMPVQESDRKSRKKSRKEESNE